MLLEKAPVKASNEATVISKKSQKRSNKNS